MLQETMFIWKSCWIKTKPLNLDVIRSYLKWYILQYEVFNSTTTCICTNFPFKKYGWYGIHKSTINVPTNLNIMEIVLPWLPHDDSSIFKQIKNKNRNIYMLGYVHPNIIIRVLQQFYLTFL